MQPFSNLFLSCHGSLALSAPKAVNLCDREYQDVGSCGLYVGYQIPPYSWDKRFLRGVGGDLQTYVLLHPG
jgi:hypothetical protein